MHFLVTTLIKDLRRRLADPIALILWIGIPLVIGWLMTLAMGGDGGGVPKAKVLLVDQDDSFLTQLLEGAGSNSESFLDIERVELDEGRARLDRGEGSALLILPAGFTANSVDANIVDNQLGGPPAVPAMTAWSRAILGLVLAGLGLTGAWRANGWPTSAKGGIG